MGLYKTEKKKRENYFRNMEFIDRSYMKSMNIDHLLVQFSICWVAVVKVLVLLGQAAQNVLLTQKVCFGHWLQGGKPFTENVPAEHVPENVKK